jgi:hypothetical protein
LVDEEANFFTIFSPHYLERAKRVQEQNLKFVQYTSAEAAANILRTEEVWLRNAQCMNDYSEIEHGLDCLIRTFQNEQEGAAFRTLVEEIYPGILAELISLFDSWVPYFRNGTYIACVSEHPVSEDQYGRLSMWRAYGGDTPVALVLNKEPFLAETDIFHAYTSPVAYLDTDNFKNHFSALTGRIDSNREVIMQLGQQKFKDCLFEVFKNCILSVKHPGFEEEREWRVVYSPAMRRSDHVKTSMETINGVPQQVHKIPLKNFPEDGFEGASISDFIARIIIGPSDQQEVLFSTFVSLLQGAGCADAVNRVHKSGIPLR